MCQLINAYYIEKETTNLMQMIYCAPKHQNLEDLSIEIILTNQCFRILMLDNGSEVMLIGKIRYF